MKKMIKLFIYSGVFLLVVATIIFTAYLCAKDEEVAQEIQPVTVTDTKYVILDVLTQEVDDFDFYRQMIGEFAVHYDVDPYLAIAISRLETGNFTSDLFFYHSNWGGMIGMNGGYITYFDKVEGLQCFMEMLSNKCTGSTIEEIAKWYCPDSTTWADCVKRIHEEEKENRL